MSTESGQKSEVDLSVCARDYLESLSRILLLISAFSPTVSWAESQKARVLTVCLQLYGLYEYAENSS